MDKKSTPPTTAHMLRVVGITLCIVGMVWLRMTSSFGQVVLAIGLAGVGLWLAWLGQRDLNEAKRAEVEQRIAERNRGEQ